MELWEEVLFVTELYLIGVILCTICMCVWQPYLDVTPDADMMASNAITM